MLSDSPSTSSGWQEPWKRTGESNSQKKSNRRVGGDLRQKSSSAAAEEEQEPRSFTGLKDNASSIYRKMKKNEVGNVGEANRLKAYLSRYVVLDK